MVRSETAVRKRILDGVRELFFRFGFSKVTMDEAAEKLGMSKKTLYQHFPSKEDLVQAVARDHMDEMDGEIKCLCAAKGSPLEKLKTMMTYVTGVYARMSESLVHDLRRSAPGIWKQVEQCRRDHIFNELGGLIKEGRRKGIFRKDVDEKLFLLIYFNTMQTLMNPEALSGLAYKPSEVFDGIVKVLFEGLLTEKARAEYHARS